MDDANAEDALFRAYDEEGILISITRKDLDRLIRDLRIIAGCLIASGRDGSAQQIMNGLRELEHSKGNRPYGTSNGDRQQHRGHRPVDEV
jgi:hypothetical protein